MPSRLEHPPTDSTPMSDAPYFVMLWGDLARTLLIPLKHIDGDVILYNSVDEAREAARDTIAGVAYGFDVFRMGEGLESRDGQL